MKTRNLHMMVLVVGAVLSLIIPASANAQAGEQEGQTQAAAKKAAQPAAVYHLEFVWSELEAGKRLNSRSYAMDEVETRRGRLRVGTRVPVVYTEEKKLDYLDVGMNIDCEARSNKDLAWLKDDEVWLDVSAEASSFALDANGKASYSAGNPIMQSIRTAMTTVVPLGKPTVISTVDDPNSKRTFELTVKATLVK
jgi:hypothetical protein